ncbi:MAG: hypothetical protein JWM59_1236 [Verrucomicrobiales bacterium]|nr:hypothetical protein [Verrucomicrobiales bacterium]
MSAPSKIFAFVLLMMIGAPLSSPAAGEEPKMKTVTIDKFFDGQLQPLPLRLSIPANYVHAKGMDVEETYSYWMPPSEVKAAAASGDLPVKTGYIYGKISMSMAWLPDKKKFSGEAGYKESLKEDGITLISERHRDANGYPVWASIASAKSEDGKSIKRLYMAYLATKIETNCIYIAYMPPAKLPEAESDKIWNSIIDSIGKK